MLITHLHPNGKYAKNFVKPLIDAEKNLGINSELIISNKYKLTSSTYIPYAVTSFKLKSIIKFLFGTLQLYKHLSKTLPSIIITHNTTSSPTPIILAKIIGVKRIIYFNHGVPFVGHKGILMYLLKFCEYINIKFSDEVITVSNTMADYLKKLTNLPTKISVINNGSACGIDIKISKKYIKNIINFKKISKIPSNSKIICFIGRATARKGAFLAIDIWKNKFNNDKNIFLVMIGVEKKEVVNKVKDIPKNIIFTGYTNKVFDILLQSDCYIMLSEHEGLPYSVLESMLLKCPVISINISGISEILNKNNSYLIDNKLSYSKKIEKVSSQIKTIIKNKKTHTEKVKKAYKDIHKFNREEFLKYYLKKLNES